MILEQNQELAKGYNRSALVYDTTAGMEYLTTLQRLLPSVRVEPQPAVLDAGCGTGINLLEIARIIPSCRKLVGVDLSPGMLSVARRKAAMYNVPAEFTVGDIQHLEQPDDEFDLVICNGVLHWIEDRQKVVSDFARVLKPGGQLVLACVAAPGFGEWVAVVSETWQKLFPGTRPWFPDLPRKEELTGQLTAAGFDIERIHHRVQSQLIRDIPAFLQTMSIIAPNWLIGVPPGSEDALIRALTATLEAELPMGFKYTTAALEVVARKLDETSRSDAE